MKYSDTLIILLSQTLWACGSQTTQKSLSLTLGFRLCYDETHYSAAFKQAALLLGETCGEMVYFSAADSTSHPRNTEPNRKKNTDFGVCCGDFTFFSILLHDMVSF